MCVVVLVLLLTALNHPTQRLFKKSEENSSRDSLLQVFLSYSHCPSDK